MKLTERELNEFPFGTIIYYENYEKYFKLDNSNEPWREIIDGYWISNKAVLNAKIQKVEIPTYTEYIPPKHILDDKEKEYLSAVIRPFKKVLRYISKNSCAEDEYILISLKNDIVCLPNFKAGTMYKGMELRKDYSLEELNIWWKKYGKM